MCVVSFWASPSFWNLSVAILPSFPWDLKIHFVIIDENRNVYLLLSVMLSFFITVFIIVIFSVLLGCRYLKKAREKFFHCDALAQRSVFFLRNAYWEYEKTLCKSVKEEDWKEKENIFRILMRKKNSFTS